MNLKINHVTKGIVSVVIALFILVLVSCGGSGKHDNPIPPKTKTQLLTGFYWSESLMEFGNSVATLAVKPLNENNSIKFLSSADDKGTWVSGQSNGIWELTNNETTLVITATNSSYTLSVGVTITEGTLVILYPQGNYFYSNPDGSFTTYTYERVTYSH